MQYIRKCSNFQVLLKLLMRLVEQGQKEAIATIFGVMKQSVKKEWEKDSIGI